MNCTKICGVIFVLFEIIMIIDICYVIGEKMVEIYNNGSILMEYILIVSAIIIHILLIFLNYKNFT